MNTKALAASTLLSLCACGAQLATDQPPSEAGADVAASGTLQDAGASVPVIDDATTADVDATVACQGPNPVGCAGLPDACQPGFFCDTDPAHGCAPSRCGCSPPQGWGCSADCGGGVCRAIEDSGTQDGGASEAAARAYWCCGGNAHYISCSQCTWCDDAGAPLPGNPNWCALFGRPGVCCPNGRLDLCDYCKPDAEATADAAPDANPCCPLNVNYISCHACDRCIPDGGVSPLCGPGRICAPGDPVCQLVDAGVDAEATDADAAPMCCRGTPLTCAPGICPVGAE